MASSSVTSCLLIPTESSKQITFRTHARRTDTNSYEPISKTDQVRSKVRKTKAKRMIASEKEASELQEERHEKR